MNERIFYEHSLKRVISINKIISLFYSELNRNFASLGERHDFWELVYVDKGCIRVNTDDESFILEKGQICFHRPMEYHQHDSFPNNEPSICIVSFACDDSILNVLTKKHLTLPDHCQKLLSQVLRYGTMVFSSIVDDYDQLYLIENESHPLYCEQMVLNYLEILLLEMSNLVASPEDDEQKLPSNSSSTTAKNHEKKLAERALEYISQNIFSNIRIPEMCEYLACSKTALSVAFKAYTGKTIIQYVNKQKIEKAKDIIRSQDLNLSQISELLNFCSLNYFSNSFKSYTGMYPSEYAQSIKAHNYVQLLSSGRGAEGYKKV